MVSMRCSFQPESTLTIGAQVQYKKPDNFSAWSGDRSVYLQYFGLVRPPYRITPDTALFYGGGERGDILDALVYAVTSGEAITKVVGEVGSGKTMLCRMLEQRLPEHVDVVYLANPSLLPEHVLHAIAFELKLPVSAADSRIQQMKVLQACLLQRHSENRQVVIFIEEAQSMALETLEEIRLLSNLETEHHKLLQVVLFGQPELDVGLSHPRVRQIRERITNSFYLAPLRHREVRDYLTFRLHLAGFRRDALFSVAAVWLMTYFSAGLMRRLNILADKAMLAAYASASQQVTWRHVWAAARDCEFVQPATWLRPVLALPALALVVALGLYSQLNVADATQVAAVPASQGQVEPQPADVALARLNSDENKVADKGAVEKADISTSLLQQRLDSSRRWLSHVAPQHFTIQLLWAPADGQQALETFLGEVRDSPGFDQMYAYRAGASEAGALNLVFGEFDSYREAKAVLHALPDSLKRYQPFLRNVRGVLAEARPTLVADASEVDR